MSNEGEEMKNKRRLIVAKTVPEFCMAALVASQLNNPSIFHFPVVLEQDLQPYTQNLLEEVAHFELDSTVIEQYFSQAKETLEIDSHEPEHIPLLLYLSMAMNIPPAPSSIKELVGELPPVDGKQIRTVEVKNLSKYMELLESLPHVDCTKMVVAWGNESSAFAGAFYAYVKGVPFFTISRIEELEQLIKTVDPEWITFFTTIEQLSLPLILKLFEYQLQRSDICKNTFSIMTGRDFPALSRMIYKTQNPHTEWKHEGVLLRVEDRPTHSDDPDISITTRNQSTVDVVESLSEKAMQALNLIINGLNMHYYLEDGAICGGYYNKEPSIAEPPCKGNGKLECDLFNRHINAQDIRVNHVMSDSCSNILPYTGEFGKDFNVFLNFLDGYACSFIGSIRLKSAAEHESPLYHQLIRSGYTMGQIINILNRSSMCMPFDYSTYVFFGDPEIRANPPDHGSLTSHVEEKEGHILITLKNVDAPLIHLTLDAPSFLSSAQEGKLFVKNRTPTRMTLYYIVLPDQDNDQLHVFVYGWSRIVCEELVIEVTDEPPLSEGMRELLNRNLKYLLRSHLYNVKSSKLSGMIKDYDSFMSTITKVLVECKYNANAHKVVDSKVGKLHQRLQRIWHEIMARILHRGDVFFMDEYSASFFPTGVSVLDLECPYCGGPLFERVMTYAMGEGEIRRCLICSRCLVLCDAPVDKSIQINPTIKGNPKIGGSELLYLVGDADFVITFSNDTEIPAMGIVFCKIAEVPPERRKEFIFEPKYYEFYLEPGEEKSWTFTVSIPERIPRFLIYTYVISNIRIYWAQKYLSKARIRGLEEN